MVGPVAHSGLGASSMKRWRTCPGSWALSRKGQDPHGSSVHAAAGTVAHGLAEETLNSHHWISVDYIAAARSPVGPVGPVVQDGHAILVDQEMVDAVQVFVDEVRARSHVAGTKTETFNEVQLDLSPWWSGVETQPIERPFGTSDVVVFNHMTGRLSVMDYKHGSGIYVAVEDNDQALYYAAGVLVSLARPRGWRVREIELVIVQPRTEGYKPVRVQIIDVLDLRRWVDNVLKPAVAAVREPNAALVTGAHCRFCPAITYCPARVDMARAVARDEFAPGPLSDDELAARLDDALVIETTIAGWREEAEKRLDKGAVLPGWAMVPTRPTVRWKDEAKTREWLRRAGTAECLRAATPGQVRKAMTEVWHSMIDEQSESVSSGTKLGVIPKSTGSALEDDASAPDGDGFAF